MGGRGRDTSGMVVEIPIHGLDLAGGTVHDPLAALLFCTPQNVRHSVINGKAIVFDGHSQPVDPPTLIKQHNGLARQLVNRRQKHRSGRKGIFRRIVMASLSSGQHQPPEHS